MQEASTKASMSPRQYLGFLLVGGLCTVISIACRELVRLTLGDEGVLRYAISVLIAYGVGMIAGFLMNRRYTFGSQVKWSAFPRFVLVGLVGMTSTLALSLVLRPMLAQLLNPQFSGTAAFVGAALISSLLTYPLNALLVFRTQRVL
jgi:putative flippase GtrA